MSNLNPPMSDPPMFPTPIPAAGSLPDHGHDHDHDHDLQLFLQLPHVPLHVPLHTLFYAQQSQKMIDCDISIEEVVLHVLEAVPLIGLGEGPR